MSDDSTHVDFEGLNDFADEALSASERATVQAHLAGCGECAERLARLRGLLRGASALPAAIEPPHELWSDIAARIVAPTTSRRPTPPPNERPHRAAQWLVARPWILTAAAVLLVVATSAITTMLVRRSPSAVVADRPVSQPVVVLPASARAVEADYARTVRELDETLASHRATLDPATIAKVEASLRVIDEAIDEARRALANDPVNLTLLDILSANYERKLELLRRATELPSST